VNLFGHWLDGIDKKDKVQIQVGILLLFWSIWNVGNDFAFKKARASSSWRLFLWAHIKSYVAISPNNATCGYEFFFATIGMIAYIKTNGCVYAFGILRHFCMIFFRRTQEETIQMMICKRYYIHVENLEKLYYDFFRTYCGDLMLRLSKHSWYRIQLLERWLAFVFGEYAISALKKLLFLENSDMGFSSHSSWMTPSAPGRVILFAVTEFLATGSQVPLLLVIDAIWKVG
jgi:hypothetical protein